MPSPLPFSFCSFCFLDTRDDQSPMPMLLQPQWSPCFKPKATGHGPKQLILSLRCFPTLPQQQNKTEQNQITIEKNRLTNTTMLGNLGHLITRAKRLFHDLPPSYPSEFFLACSHSHLLHPSHIVSCSSVSFLLSLLWDCCPPLCPQQSSSYKPMGAFSSVSCGDTQN